MGKKKKKKSESMKSYLEYYIDDFLQSGFEKQLFYFVFLVGASLILQWPQPRSQYPSHL